MTKRRPNEWWLVAGVVLMVVTMIFAVAEASSQAARNAFASFQPGIELFPTAPVADAATYFGPGEPRSWPDLPLPCSSGQELSDFELDPYRDWYSVRHDWTDGDQPKSWIVSETTMVFDDLAGYDGYVAAFRQAVNNCGWSYSRVSNDGYNSIPVELAGMPSDSFAFRIDISPWILSDKIGNSDPDDFFALGAVLPGRQRGLLMFVTWIGWGVDVPEDQFAGAANDLYDAAHKGSRPIDANVGDRDSDTPATDGDGAGGSVDPIEFDLARADVLPLLGATFDDYYSSNESRYTGGHMADLLRSDNCDQRQLEDLVVRSAEPSASFEAQVSPDARYVWFWTAQWESSSDYLEVATRITSDFGTLCVDSDQHQPLEIERVTLPGLPPGTVVSRWRSQANFAGPVDSLVAVLTDDDRHALMVVEWTEEEGTVSDADFVAAVNQAWASF